MEQMDLSDFFKTKMQANDFSTRLAAISEKIYAADFDLEKTLMEELGIQKKDKFISLLRNNKIAIESHPALQEFLTKLQQNIASMPVLSLTLAFEPKEKTLLAIAQWLSLNMNRQAVLEIIIDRELIAGAAISFNGKYRNCSIRSKFDQILEENLTENNQRTQSGAHQSAEFLSLGR